MKALLDKVHHQSDVTLSLKRTLLSVIKVPETLEELTSTIERINYPQETFLRVSLQDIEKPLIKARFYIDSEDLDFI